LENPDLARLADPCCFQDLKAIVIDESSVCGSFAFAGLADRPRKPARFLILGSASPELLRQGAESLAGRVIFHELKGFGIDEVGVAHLERLWGRGGFPRAYLARTDAESFEWRRAFIQTFLERDLPQLGINIRSAALRRFWACWHYRSNLEFLGFAGPSACGYDGEDLSGRLERRAGRFPAPSLA
jgi:hypothetical protein